MCNLAGAGGGSSILPHVMSAGQLDYSLVVPLEGLTGGWELGLYFHHSLLSRVFLSTWLLILLVSREAAGPSSLGGQSVL